jgi:hypothetical protein
VNAGGVGVFAGRVTNVGTPAITLYRVADQAGTASGDASISSAGVFTVRGTAAQRVAYIPATDPQALSGPGVLDLTSFQTRFTSTGTGDALSLADAGATEIGLLKKVSYVAEGGGADTGVITPASASGFTTATLNAIGDYVVFMWNGTAWIVLEYMGATIA